MKYTNATFFSSQVAAAITIALLTLVLSYLCAYRWHTDGFTLMEVSVLSVLPALIIFFMFMVNSIIFINKYRRDELADGAVPINKWISVSILVVLSLLILFGMDWLFFSFIDNSIPYDFAEGLKEVAASGGESVDDLNDFQQLPFTVQNSVTIIGSALFAGLFSVLFIKSDGIMFKTKLERM